MRELMLLAERAGALLKARGQTIALNESSTGGLISAALLAVPGFREEELGGIRAATEHHALARARIARGRFNTIWGLGETGAAGPTGNRYGDPAGHTCVAVAGPLERALTVRTGKTDRLENMHAFAAAALKLLVESLEAQQ